jgi:drug/metabolite transporter (DMT)-like permease
MRLFLLTALTMAAFAGNSVLNRMAVGQELIGAFAFSAVRLLSGAAMLGLILGLRLALRRQVAWPDRWVTAAGVGGLLLYLLGFSTAYRDLDAGTGALVLFGAVQVTMFAGAVLAREPLSLARWLGAGLALAGLSVLAAPPPGEAPPVFPMAAMAAAGLGWGVYSLAGQRQRDAQAATAVNFVLAVPLMLGLHAGSPGWLDTLPANAPPSPEGTMLAVLSGAVTSGLGYALWYAILPALGAGRAAVAQLTVPLIAAAGGAVLLSEGPGWRFAVAAVLVLGGVALASLQSGLTRR